MCIPRSWYVPCGCLKLCKTRMFAGRSCGVVWRSTGPTPSVFLSFHSIPFDASSLFGELLVAFIRSDSAEPAFRVSASLGFPGTLLARGLYRPLIHRGIVSCWPFLHHTGIAGLTLYPFQVQHGIQWTL